MTNKEQREYAERQRAMAKKVIQEANRDERLAQVTDPSQLNTIIRLANIVLGEDRPE